jgi:prevent-host-death family protein
MEASIEPVSAFEAKTRLSELLRETEKGVSFRILRRGKEVARLIPPSKQEKRRDLKQVTSLFRDIRSRVQGKIRVRELMEEGRRF